MGRTVVSRTVASETIRNDHEVVGGRLVEQGYGGPADAALAFANFGTSPSGTMRGSGGHFEIAVTSGSGTPTAAATITIDLTGLGAAPRACFVKETGVALGFHVVSISASQLVLGVKNAPAASTAYVVEGILVF